MYSIWETCYVQYKKEFKVNNNLGCKFWKKKKKKACS